MSTEPNRFPDSFQIQGAAPTPDQTVRARDVVLHGIDRGLYDAAGAPDILEHLGLIEPLKVPPKRRAK